MIVHLSSVGKLQVLPHIIGQKGKTKLKVEQDTGATVIIPRKNSTALPGSRDADVVVRGPTTSAAVSAATRLELLVENVLNSNKYALCFGLYLSCMCSKTSCTQWLHLSADWNTLTSSLFHLIAKLPKLPFSSSSQVSQKTLKLPRPKLKNLSL